MAVRRSLKVLVLALLMSLLPVASITPITQAIAATSDKCDGSSTQNNVRVTNGHGKVFYIDSGQGQNVDASYVSYRVFASGARSNVWVKLENFTGGVVGLANPNDAIMPIGNMSSETKTAFFLLKAGTSSTKAQSHVVRVYSGKPDLSGSTELYSCTFTFQKVMETIKASANKVDSTVVSGTAILGNTLTITVQGATGTVGSGNASPDKDILWFSPAAFSSWPTSALRLISTSVDLFDNPSRGSNQRIAGYPKTDQLIITGAQSLGGKIFYTNTYTFRVIGQSASAPKIAPIAQISSGTQIKHTDMSNLPIASVPTNSVTVNASLTKSVSSTVSQVAGKTRFSYTLTLRNSDASNATTFDQVTDVPDPSLTYVSGTVRLDGVATAEPATNAQGQLVFSLPITVNANSSRTLTYTMEESTGCTNSTNFAYQNSATAKIGSVTVGSGPSTYSVTNAGGTCGLTTLTDTSTVNTQLPVEVTTSSPSAVDSATATLNGLVDPNGNSGQTVVFEWGTSPTLATYSTATLSATTTNSTTPYAVNRGITGLSPGTVYYYRIRVGNVYGAILSFVTLEPVANPTATTTSVSGMTLSGGKYSVTLNGTIDPNQTTTGGRFEYILDPNQSTHACTSLGTPTSQVIQVGDEQQNGSISVVDFSANSAFPVEVSSYTQVTNLTSGQWYCYRTVATFASGTANGSWVSFYTGTMNSQTITFPQPTSKNTTDTFNLTGSDSASATSGLAITYSSNTTDVCVVNAGPPINVTFLKGGICSLTASQPGNQSFYAADPVTVTFQVIAPNKTVIFNSNGGSGSMSNQVTNVPTSLTANSFTRSGYSFIGWSTSSGVQTVLYQNTDSYDFSADMTVYAQWQATITYDANGATSGSVPASQTGGPGASISTQGNSGTLAKSNLNFSGWNTAANGTGTAYATGASYTIAGNATLYAQFTAVLTYSGNGQTSASGTVPSAVTKLPGSETLAAQGSLVKTNWTFDGWNTNSAGSGTNYSAGSVYNLTQNVTLYAKWIATITYDSNTADSGAVPSPQTGVAGNYTLASNSGSMVKSGATFGGWNTQANGLGTTYASGASYTLAGNVTLYAIWTDNSKYRIDYNGNGSTGGSAPAAQLITIGQSSNVSNSSGSLTRTGYTFSRWDTATAGNGTSFALGAPITPTSNVTLYAVWTPNSLTVTYLANGGSGTMSADTVIAGTATPLSTNTFSRTNYNFAGWNDTSTATGTDYTNGQSITILENLTLYAKWTATITYDGNNKDGGSVPASQTQADGSITLRSNTGNLTRTGFTFAGWNTAANGSGTDYAESASYTLAGSVTLFAKWSANSLTVNFNGNNEDSGTMSNQTITAGTPTALTSNAYSRSGFTFSGWNTAANGSGTSYSDGQSVTIYTNLNLYARWQNSNSNAPTPEPTPTPIVKTDPTITWNKPADIFEGTPLSSQLNAVFSVPGTCVYSPASGTVLPAGTHTLSVTCTPTDTTRFNSKTTTVTITVLKVKKKPLIIWFNPASIEFPTPLTGIQLNALASVAGSYTYTPGAGTLLNPGTHALNVKFNPNSNDFEPLEANVTILVTQKVTPSPSPTTSRGPNPSPSPSASRGPNASPSPAAPNRRPTPSPSASPIVDDKTPKAPALPPAPEVKPKQDAAPVFVTAKKEEVVTVIPNENRTGYIVSSQDWSLGISSTTQFVQGQVGEAFSKISIEKGNTVTTQGTGFKPFSQVDLYAFSTPIYLGSTITDQFGNFTKTVPMPDSLPVGDHTFQVNGLTPDEKTRTASVPITLLPATAKGKPGQLKFSVYYALDSIIVTNSNKKVIDRYVRELKNKTTQNSRVTVSVVGWVQPTRVSPRIAYLSSGRAKAVVKILRASGVKAVYSIRTPGHDKLNIAPSRRADVVITWTNSK